jgi:hypothetical protein
MMQAKTSLSGITAFVLLLLAFSGNIFASGQKLWEFDLRRNGYPEAPDATVRFWGHYVITGNRVPQCDSLDLSAAANFDLNRLPKLQRDHELQQAADKLWATSNSLVFDVATGRQVPRKLLANETISWDCLPSLHWGDPAPGRVQLIAHMENTWVLKDNESNFYLERQGVGRTLFCSRCKHFNAVAPLGSELFLMKPAYGHHDFEVRDAEGRKRYAISRLCHREGCDVVFNRQETRFATVENYQSVSGHFIYLGDNIFNHNGPLKVDQKRLRVFSSATGSELFGHTWKDPEEAEYDYLHNREKIAFSDDGSFLAIVTHEAKLLVFKISENER